MTPAINTPVTSKPIQEPSRELTENELAHVSGGIIAILVGRSLTGLGSPEELQARK
jgi:bacteriocin-like protein